MDGGSSAAHDGGLGEEAGLVAASVERAPLFVEEEALAQQAVDGRPVATPFRLGELVLVELAPFVEVVLLQLEDDLRDGDREVAIGQPAVALRVCGLEDGLGERADLGVQRDEQRGDIEPRPDAVLIARPGEDDRAEQLAGELGGQAVGSDARRGSGRARRRAAA